ncbi:uncharacterized conserved protein [Moesziomyces antarcticus T-34]|uniref:Uncharacterized conserved protein n=1 Tax=Pseudozyma antarctica (strain T-34) TaxID=1151754 RepID=M9MIW0_PSEA3|nr:uncharacterized conserved protein [Moesziomyces antarcticus T-34]
MAGSWPPPRPLRMTDDEQRTSSPLTPPLEALYWTQYGQWYPIFRKHAPKSTLIDISTVEPRFLDWLGADIFILPDGSGPSTFPRFSSANSSASNLSHSDSDDDEEGGNVVRLESLDAAIRAVVERYDGGPIFAKLNWSAPLDASFMLAGNNLQCMHPEDVYLLLKSSEFVGRDLEQIAQTQHPNSDSAPAEGGAALEVGTTDADVVGEIRPQLVLKKWFQLARSYEFRCYVRARTLLAICQRDMTFYDHLQDAQLQQQLRTAIESFWHTVVEPSTEFPLRDYVLDVYVTKDLGRVWIIDFNAWLPRTDPLLYTFDELEQLHLHPPAQPELRVLHDKRLSSAGGTGATYSSNMVPTDLVQFAKSSARTNSTTPQSVDQIVASWNAQVDAEDAHTSA